MTLPIRDPIAALQFSRIRAVSRLGMPMQGVIPLWFGEGDVPTPAFINDAAKKALDDGATFYEANMGHAPLVEALGAYQERLYKRPFPRGRITVTASGMNALIMAMQALVEPGVSVVVVNPVWPNCRETVHIMGGRVIDVELDRDETGFRLDLDKLFDACDATTRAIFINSPGNPTGWMMKSDQQQAVLDFARQRGLWIIADEVYARLVYDRPVAPSFLELAGPDDPVVSVNSFSKAWTMTGWRLGWITHPAALSDTFEKLVEFNISGPASFVQRAGVVAVRDGEPFVAELIARYRVARDLVVQRLGAMRRVRLARPEAAFYAFFAVDGMKDSLAFATDLLTTAKVGLAPGVAFGKGGEGHLRLCFAASLPKLTEALDRLGPALDR
ncbi:MAG: aminotransferase class I/II-fold pyridoxal phosphate-dependent enzyme [Alphaproteobacteria bacterium]|nr:aminotransferase class I/II-fold pyridoxal phosphate-dependent enzyme [Alphaproteobacteria bacterium]